MMQWDKLMRQPLCQPCQIESLIAPLVFGGLGALAGAGGGGDINQTVTTIPPMPNAQQQIMINQLANWLYQNYPTYQNYINQTLSSIYGGSSTAPTVGGVTDIPGQLSGEAATAHEENVQKVAQFSRKVEDYNNAAKSLFFIKHARNLLDHYAETTGKYTTRDIDAVTSAYYENMKAQGIADIEAKDYLDQYTANPKEFEKDFLGNLPVMEGYELPEGLNEDSDFVKKWEYIQNIDPLKESTWGTPLSAEAQAAAQEGIAETQAWSPFQEIMSWNPEKISEYYSLEKQKQQREIQDWYNQATREYEQRGISQSGGYLGSRQETDLSKLLGEKGRLESTLSTALGQAELAQKQQQPYQMLEAAQSLLGTMQNLQTPWMQLGQGLTTPYGATTQTSVMPGASSAQGALAGGLTGLGIAGMGQGLGWWGSNQPATSFGWNMAGQTPAQAYPFSLAGTQNLWNTNPWSLGG